MNPSVWFILFIYVNHTLKQLFNTISFGADGRYDWNPDHFRQRMVIEFIPLINHFVMHVQCNDHFYIHIDQLGGEVKISFQVFTVENIDYHIWHFP